MGNNLLAEKYFFDAAKLLGERDFDNMPSTDKLKGWHSFSDKFEAEIAKILSSFDAHSIKKSTVRRILLIAAIIALILAFAMSSSALRERAYELFTLRTFSYTDVDFKPILPDDSTNFSACYEEPEYLSPSDELTVLYEPLLIPNGYKELERIVAPLSNMIVYTNESDELMIFQQCVMDTSIRLNTENSECSVLVEDGITFYVTVTNSNCRLLWEQEGYIFSLDAMLTTEESVKIARSIRTQ